MFARSADNDGKMPARLVIARGGELRFAGGPGGVE